MSSFIFHECVYRSHVTHTQRSSRVKNETNIFRTEKQYKALYIS